MNKVRVLVVTFLTGALAVLGLAAPRASAASSGTRPVTDVSGDPAIWPGDTFGISVLPGRHGHGAPEHIALSWGSAVGGSKNSEIHATVVGR